MRFSTLWCISLIIYTVELSISIKNCNIILDLLIKVTILLVDGRRINKPRGKIPLGTNLKARVRSRGLIIKCCGFKRCMPGLKMSSKRNSSTPKTTMVNNSLIFTLNPALIFFIACDASHSTPKTCCYHGNCRYDVK
jgi:hypothetical protein